jgi:hypothetical protein
MIVLLMQGNAEIRWKSIYKQDLMLKSLRIETFYSTPMLLRKLVSVVLGLIVLIFFFSSSIQAKAQELERARASDSLRKGLESRPERQELVDRRFSFSFFFWNWVNDFILFFFTNKS